MQTTISFIMGLLFGAGFIWFANSSKLGSKKIFGYGLIIVAIIYVIFALRASSSYWLAVELTGVVLYGAMGSLGIRGSNIWLIVGWALHPIWDIALHYLGPGASFVPDWYAVSCVSFDLLVAGYIAYANFYMADKSPQQTARDGR